MRMTSKSKFKNNQQFIKKKKKIYLPIYNKEVDWLKKKRKKVAPKSSNLK